MSALCGSAKTYVHSTRKEPERWCFGERKRQTGTWELHVDTDPMSYWEPFWTFKCDGCGQDRMYGFGGYREWL
jgi:hypothetical protein